MKKIKYLLLVLVSLPVFMSCSEEDLDTNTIFPDEPAQRNAFDQWLYENYTIPFNMEFRYKWSFTENSYAYALVPADVTRSQKMAQFFKTQWMDSYIEAVDSTFLKTYSPKLIVLTGEPMYVGAIEYLAYAAGGVDIHLHDINHFGVSTDKEKAQAQYYLTAVHHEFCHILNQRRIMPAEFKTVNQGDYVGTAFQDSTIARAYQLGFVTQYARMNYNEDFAETYRTYISSTQTAWLMLLAKMSATGKQKVSQKLDYIRTYMKDSFGLNLDEMRSIVLRKELELGAMSDSDFLTF